MFDVWLFGFIIMCSITALAIGCCCFMAFEDEEMGPIKFASILLVTGPLCAVLWPLIIAAAVLSGVGYGLFNAARVIRHRDFEVLFKD